MLGLDSPLSFLASQYIDAKLRSLFLSQQRQSGMYQSRNASSCIPGHADWCSKRDSQCQHKTQCSHFKASFAWLLRSRKQMQQTLSRHAMTQHRHTIRCHACNHRSRSWLLCHVQVESETLAQLVFDSSAKEVCKSVCLNPD